MFGTGCSLEYVELADPNGWSRGDEVLDTNITSDPEKSAELIVEASTTDYNSSFQKSE